MKKLIFLLLLIFPAITFAQIPWKKSSPLDYTWKYVGNQGFTYGGIWWDEEDISLVFNPIDNNPYLAFADWSYGGKITLLKFSEGSWQVVGIPGFSADTAYFTSLAFNSAGEPYVAYMDLSQNSKASVMKFDGTNWVYVGDQGFSNGWAWYTSLAFSPSGEPYIAFGDGMYGRKATVMKFDGNNWINVGNSQFSPGLAMCTWLAFSPKDGDPYVAFVNGAAGYKATVMKFNGNNWIYVGDSSFYTLRVSNTSLAFNPIDSIPYVAFQDDQYYHHTTVKKLNGNNWVDVGNENFSAGWADYPILAFSKTGVPYVGYGDEENSYHATVMKFDGSNWVNVGNPGFSDGGMVWTNSLAISPEGVPYFAYKECPDGNCDLSVMKFDSVFVGLNNTKSNPLLIYPNPASSTLTIDLSGLPTQNELSTIEVLDLSGTTILRILADSKKISIDISTYPAGIYFVRMKMPDSVFMGKFCKR
jgi:hypothetical protein